MPLDPSLQAPLQTILTSLINLQTAGGGHSQKRYYSYLFRDLPDKRLYADYYVLIKEPRSLHGVLDSVKKGIYSSAQGVAYDLFLVWSNAREYNEQGSQVYNDAEKLEGYMQKLWNERSPPLPPFHALPRPGSFGPSAGSSKEVDTHKPKRIKITSSLGPSTSTPAPMRTSIKPRLINNMAPGPSTPSAPSITLRLGSKSTPVPTPAPAPVFHLTEPRAPQEGGDEAGPSSVRKRAREDSPGSLAAAGGVRQESRKERKAREKAAKHAAKAAAKDKDDEDGEGGEGAAVIFPGIPDEDSGWMGGDTGANPIGLYVEIVRKLKEHTDASGRLLATPILSLPDPATRPDYYQAIKEPVALDTIEEKARAGIYPTPEAFDRDLHHLFSIAKRFIKPDTPGKVYTDLLVLQRLYQELTKRVSHLSPPKSLDLAALSSVAAGPGNIHGKSGETADEQNKSLIASRVTLKDKIFLDGINYKGDVFRVGDWVHLLNPDNPAKPIIAQIFKVYKRTDSPQRCISVCWYYRPEETVHPASRQFYDHEVFKTSNFVDHSIEDLVERCFVMFFTRYVRGRPKIWYPGMPLYVVEHRYKDDVKSFKKIKNWNSCVPEEVRKNEYELVPFPDERVDILRRIKSPFVRGVAGPGGIGEAMENEEEDQARYHFLPSGEPATVQRVKVEMQAAAEAGSSMALYGAPVAVPAPLPSIPPLAFVAPVATPPTVSGATPAEQAIATESFYPLPVEIRSKFRADESGDLLWFTAPALSAPAPSRPTHSLEYLYWRAQRLAGAKMDDGHSANGADVEMVDGRISA